jgi:hypothetical protein
LYVFAARGASRAWALEGPTLGDLSRRKNQGRGAPGFTRVRQTSYGLHALVIVESDADLRDSGAASRELPAEKRSSFAAAAAANSSNACSVWFLVFM